MRKAATLLLSFVTVLILTGLSKASFEGELLKNSSLYRTMDLKSGEFLKNIIILPKTGYDKNAAAAIIRNLDHIPAEVLRSADNQGIKLKLFEGKLTENPSAARLKGLTPRGYTGKDVTWDSVPGVGGAQTVLVKIGSSSPGKNHGSLNLELHEFAHSLQNYVYHNSSATTFLEIWQSEARSMFPGNEYLNNYASEYFAESFAYYYFSPDSRDTLLKRAPRTFKYLEKLKPL